MTHLCALKKFAIFLCKWELDILDNAVAAWAVTSMSMEFKVAIGASHTSYGTAGISS